MASIESGVGTDPRDHPSGKWSGGKGERRRKRGSRGRMRREGTSGRGGVEKSSTAARSPCSVDGVRVVEVLNGTNDGRVGGRERLSSIENGRRRIERSGRREGGGSLC